MEIKHLLDRVYVLQSVQLYMMIIGLCCTNIVTEPNLGSLYAVVHSYHGFTANHANMLWCITTTQNIMATTPTETHTHNYMHTSRETDR